MSRFRAEMQSLYSTVRDLTRFKEIWLFMSLAIEEEKIFQKVQRIHGALEKVIKRSI